MNLERLLTILNSISSFYLVFTDGSMPCVMLMDHVAFFEVCKEGGRNSVMIQVPHERGYLEVSLVFERKNFSIFHDRSCMGMVVR